MGWRATLKTTTGLVFLSGLLIGAGTVAPTCNASCQVDGETGTWTCNCRWAVPLGLSCAQNTLSVPPGGTIASPEKQPADASGSSDTIELRGGQFELLDGQVTFTTTTQAFREGGVHKSYVIPYRFLDQGGQVIQDGSLPVTQINVK